MVRTPPTLTGKTSWRSSLQLVTLSSREQQQKLSKTSPLHTEEGIEKQPGSNIKKCECMSR